MWVFLIFCRVLSEIVYFVELSRHGARSPSEFMEWDKDRWLDGETALTAEGMRQHYLIGVHLRQRYIIENQLLPPEYNSTLLYTVATTAHRAQDSLQSQLLGLYPYVKHKTRATSLPPLNLSNTYDIENIKVSTFAINIYQSDPMLHSKDECQAYSTYIKMRKNSNGMKKKIAEYYDAIEVVEKKYEVSREQAEDMIFDIIASIRSNRFAGFSWDPAFDDKFIKRAQELYMMYKWYSSYTPDYIAKFVGSDFLNDIVRQLEEIKSGKMMRKGSIYSAHDTTLFSVLATLGMFPNEQPPFATLMLFEVVKKNEEYFVRVLYNMQEMAIPGCPQVLCEIDTFITYIRYRAFADTKKACLGIEKVPIEQEDLDEIPLQSSHFFIVNTAICFAEILIFAYFIFKKFQ